MSKLAQLLGLKKQVEELENEIQRETVSFTHEELIEYTKTIANAAANGFKHELSNKENFDFNGAIYTKRDENGVTMGVSRTRVLNEVINNVDFELKDENVETTITLVLSIMGK